MVSGSMVVFSSLMYIVEHRVSGTLFPNIPIGFWYTVITMTSVGYGDMFPITTLGYVIGVMCSLFGVLLLALIVPAVSESFILYYNHTTIYDAATKVRKN